MTFATAFGLTRRGQGRQNLPVPTSFLDAASETERGPATLDVVLEHAAALAPASGVVDVDGDFVSWPDLVVRQQLLAARLAAEGVDVGDRVVVLHPRSVTSFVAMHAAQRCGAIAVPIDPQAAAHSVETIIRSTEPAAIVTAATLSRRFDLRRMAPDAAIFATVDKHGDDEAPLIDMAEVLADPPVTFASRASADLDAYVIFTSGSTGTPKGIVHTHRSGMAYAEAACLFHGLDSSHRLAATAPLHFDMSTLELYAIPLAGASSIIVSEQQMMFPASFAASIEQHQATHLYAVPYQLRQLVARGGLEHRDLGHIRQISFGGEQFSDNALDSLRLAFPDAQLLNVYGPAEVNGVVIHDFGVPSQPIDEVPIGLPVPGVELHILDAEGAAVDEGARGELFVASPSTMQRYWQDPDRTSASFRDIAGRRFYCTGDRVHQDPAGRLHFHGRDDNRVKVRGVRIELEEIERVVSDDPAIIDAVAAVDRTTQPEQVHIWLIATRPEIDTRSILARCRARLPAAAVPGRFELLDNVPTTQSGKVDRRRLRSRVSPPEKDSREP